MTAEQAAQQRHTDLLFTLFFTAELLVQSMAMGFMGHEYSYLADAWNRLDCTVVVSSWLPLLFPSLDNYTAIRGTHAEARTHG